MVSLVLQLCCHCFRQVVTISTVKFSLHVFIELAEFTEEISSITSGISVITIMAFIQFILQHIWVRSYLCLTLLAFHVDANWH